MRKGHHLLHCIAAASLMGLMMGIHLVRALHVHDHTHSIVQEVSLIQHTHAGETTLSIAEKNCPLCHFEFFRDAILPVWPQLQDIYRVYTDYNAALSKNRSIRTFAQSSSTGFYATC